MELGICVASHVGDIDYVVRAEELGYTHAWLADSQMLWSDCYATLALAATQTNKIKLGTGVAITGTRPAPVNAALSSTETVSQGSSVSLNIILVVSILIFAILIVMLFLVQRTLIKIANASGVKIESEPKKNITPLWETVIKNQFLIFIMVVGLLLSSAYFTYGYLMQIGIDQGYAPIQPIHYSHKIHAGANQIECKYCHSSARVSKHSGIPALNVCMNCHENIAEYDGEEDLEKGYTKDFYTNEIRKLYKRSILDLYFELLLRHHL